MKVCSICKLPQEEFYANKRKPDGLQSFCISCSKERSKERYKDFSVEQKQEIKDRARQKVLRNKQFVWDYLKQHPCIECKEADPIVLEFDHTRDKKIAISNLAGQGVGLERLQEEIDKCEVRCVLCHRRKTAKDFGWYKEIIQ